MKQLSLFSCGLLLAALASSPVTALADTVTFNFASSSGNPPSSSQFAGNLTFDITQQSTGVYLINSISGTVNEGSSVGNGGTATVNGIIQPGLFTDHSPANDNLLYDPATSNGYSFDQGGVAFTLSDGTTIQLYGNHGFDVWITPAGSSTSKSEQIDSVTLGNIVPTGASSPTPEPGSLALFGTGALGLGGLIRRRLFR